jgi:phosphoglycolate phosphatase
MFSLKDITKNGPVTIQTHDAPDADALGSAFALYKYLESVGCRAEIIYSGRAEITKPNLLEMVVRLGIPIRYVRPPAAFATLVITDGQYGAGNVTAFDAEEIYVIDHHIQESEPAPPGIIHSGLGSNATLVWHLMGKEGFPFGVYPEVCTALYYGLFTDTGGLTEVYHPLDRDMRDTLPYNRPLVKQLQNTNLSLEELTIAGAALQHCTTDVELRYAIFKAEPCDSNILGFVSDLALQVDGIDTCVVYHILPDGARLSVRCCARDVMASDFIAFLTAGVGSGGGHMEKAGGFISQAKMAERGTNHDTYIHAQTHAYFLNHDILDATHHTLDVPAMPRYRKLPVQFGYVRTTDIYPAGTPITIRALEGDEQVTTAEDMYIMVGVLGEVYPTRANKFNQNYTPGEGAFDMAAKRFAYVPTVRHTYTRENRELAQYIRPCTATEGAVIHAKPLTRNTKLFTTWNTESYMYGHPGDYLAIRPDDHNDLYIIHKDIFAQTYERVFDNFRP